MYSDKINFIISAVRQDYHNQKLLFMQQTYRYSALVECAAEDGKI